MALCGMRERVLEDGCTGDTGAQDQRSHPVRVTVQVPFDPALDSHGFTVSAHTPPQVQEVSADGPADSRLLPGDQLIKINNIAVDDLSAEQTTDIIRECQESITMTVLRITVGPKSSFITPEKRAKLRSNPVKVRFAEEVAVGSHAQGNSLLFLPNVLKVYLENGQTKAFKFEPKTTVKDILMTLKEKLSISRIEHFSLMLEQQYSITKLFLLHEEELIQEVVQKEESHDYRCLFRICFIPKEPEHMLTEDPVSFEYLYLQSVSDVLQERFAVEMKCNTALRLAALHIQERLASTGQISKTPLKSVMKNWGIESFVSSTLLRNMREKDLRKAISYHMKKSLIQEPKNKVMTVNQARLNYLTEMAELKSYGGKSFTATMMLQDRESMVSLLVGAQYGVSHVINHKMSIMATLTDFQSISRVELLPESEHVSLVKIYMQDIKPITLLLESVAAKDLSCLVAGYCKLLVDPQICVFPWTPQSKSHRISAEEGYVSRCGSDSEDSDTDVNALLSRDSGATQTNQQVAAVSLAAVGQVEKNAKEENELEKAKNEKIGQNETADAEKVTLEELTEFLHASEGETYVKTDEEKDNVEKEDEEKQEKEMEPPCVITMDDQSSEASDSCHTESRFLTSMSSDSIDALEEDDYLTFSHPSQLHVGSHCFQSDSSLSLPSPGEPYCQDGDFHAELSSTDFQGNDDLFECFAALSSIAEYLPSPPQASEDEDCEKEVGEDEEQRAEVLEEASGSDPPLQGDYVFTFEQGDARCYYNICANVTPDSAHSLPRTQLSPSTQDKKGESGREEAKDTRSILILQPPPGFGDSSSDDEFFDAQDRFTTPEEPSSTANMTDNSTESSSIKNQRNLSDIRIGLGEKTDEKKGELQDQMENKLSRLHNRCRKRRSFMETDYTSLVSFPEKDQTKDCNRVPNHGLGCHSHVESLISCFEGGLSDQGSCPTVSSLTSTEGEPVQLESKPITPPKPSGPGTHHLLDSTASQRKQQVMLMEPDSMEFKSVTELMSTASTAIVAVCTHSEVKAIESNICSPDAEEGAVGGLFKESLTGHLFFATSKQEECDITSPVKTNDQQCLTEDLSRDSSDDQKSCSLQQPTQVPQSNVQVVTICYTSNPNTQKYDRGKGNLEIGSGKVPVEPRLRSRIQSLSAAVERTSPFLPQRHLFSQREPLIHTKTPVSNNTTKSSIASIQELSYSVPSVEPVQAYLLTPYSSGILGRLSASTLRGKIQKLPFYLSCSQEVLTGNVSVGGNTTTAKRLSETQPNINKVEVAKEATEDVTTTDLTSEVLDSIISEKVTEVTEEVRGISQANPQLQEGQKEKREPQEPSQPPKSPSFLKPVSSIKINPSSKLVTTKNLNGLWGVVTSHEIAELQGESSPVQSSGYVAIFTNSESKPTCTQPHGLPSPCTHEKTKFTCSSALAMGCETVLEGAHTPMEVCGCQAVYTNCFSGALNSDSFDDELTVYEFSCRTQQSENVHAALMTSAPHSSLSGSPSFSPSSPLPCFPGMVLPSSSSVDLGPPLSPLDGPDCFISYPHEDAIVALLARRYPLPPMGFLELQRDVDTLLTVLTAATKDQDGMQEHPRETCAEHFSENKHRLHVEARGLLAGCQQVVRIGQTPTETLQTLAESFNSLVQLTSVCLSFSSCQRCQQRHVHALAGLAGVAQSYREFAQAAEHVGTATGKRTCQDLSVKLLARKCTTLTTSVFCLTQLFRTLTAL
ncbi:hypothetical protein P4O66_012472 [Electrophorus voltai]|uniref:FERM and PDZ domain containing 1 n=1 Tax=Electrophorus voltai TaxID=2609070 RepID=A0AAD8Z6P1_9TELE|nr:hypothetical protein P4O66_012472 [Electrophorus voltai]